MNFYQSKNGIVALPVNVDGVVKELQVCVTHNDRPVLEGARSQIFYENVEAKWHSASGEPFSLGRLELRLQVSSIKQVDKPDEIVSMPRLSELRVKTRFPGENWRPMPECDLSEILYVTLNGDAVALWVDGRHQEIEDAFPAFELPTTEEINAHWKLASVQHQSGYLVCAWLNSDGTQVAASSDYVPENIYRTCLLYPKNFGNETIFGASPRMVQYAGDSLGCGLTLVGCSEFSFDIPF